MDTVLAEHFYNLAKRRKDVHAEDGVLGMNNMNDIAKVLLDLMKMEAHEHISCSAAQFSLAYMAHASEKRKRKPKPEKPLGSSVIKASRSRVEILGRRLS